MGICADCGGKAYTRFNEGTLCLCWSCIRERERKEVMRKGEEVKRISDFSAWDMGDMSELFWSHLGIYQKTPNKHSLSIMERAIMWAHHADHGLSNSFENALRWCGIDLYKEVKRTDIPETADVDGI